MTRGHARIAVACHEGQAEIGFTDLPALATGGLVGLLGEQQ